MEVFVLSVVVPWRDRSELAQALPSLVATAQRAGGDLTVVNYSGAPDLLAAQLESYRDHVRVVEVRAQRYFNKSAAQNLGASQARGQVLFFCDCDIVLDPEAVTKLAERLAHTDGIFATLAGVRESEHNSRGGRHVVSFGYELQIRTADGRRLCIRDHEEDTETGTRQAPGLLLVRREDFLAINGYNARLHGWGWEDQDMISRLTLGRGLTRVMEGYVVHLSHDDQARLAHYPSVVSRWESRDRMFRQALANYDDANFRGTYAEDVGALSELVAVSAPVRAPASAVASAAGRTLQPVED